LSKVAKEFMKDTLNQLIKLQEIDSRLLEINELKGDLPVKVEEQEIEVTQYAEENTVKTERIQEIDQECRKRSSDIDDYSAKLGKYRDQLYLVTSNKEYDALNTEIDHMKQTISGSETVLLELEEEKIQLEELLKSNSNKIETIGEALKKNKEELESALSETDSEEKKLLKSRKNSISKIDKRYFNTYERIRSARDGVAMISITRKACGSCYSQLPQQTLIEIKQNDRMFNCAICGTFLFWDGAED